MEHTIRADADGVVAEIHVAVGQSVDAHTVVATLTGADDPDVPTRDRRNKRAPCRPQVGAPARRLWTTWGTSRASIARWGTFTAKGGGDGRGARRPVRVANCSGFFGDRIGAAREMVEGGPIDVLTGDWLAELTMLILARQRMKHGAGSGYARTFLTQMEQVLGTCLERGIRVVSNAGGLDPAGCAAALRALATERGLDVRIAYVEGDDLLPRMAELRRGGRDLHQPRHRGDLLLLRHAGAHRERLPRWPRHHGRARRRCRRRHHRPRHRRRARRRTRGLVARLGLRRPRELDRPRRRRRRGPRHRVRRPGDRRQLRLLRRGPRPRARRLPVGRGRRRRQQRHRQARRHRRSGQRRHRHGPAALRDRWARPTRTPTSPRASTRSGLEQVGPDRVAISGVRGESAPETAKVALNTLGGFRNSASLVLTGLDIEAKADLALRTIAGLPLAQALSATPQANAAASRLDVRELDVQLLRRDREDPTLDRRRPGRAPAHREGVRPDEGRQGVHRTDRRVARSAPTPACSPPRRRRRARRTASTGRPRCPPGSSRRRVTLDDGTARSPWSRRCRRDAAAAVGWFADAEALPVDARGGVRRRAPRAPLGTFVGARSGDKGGNANVGLWVRPSGDSRARRRALRVARAGPDRRTGCASAAARGGAASRSTCTRCPTCTRSTS